jgi:hypothetical protein
LGTLQNVAVISSVQRAPVVGAWVGADRMLRPANCWFRVVATCAAAGDTAKSSAEINASFFIGARLSFGTLSVIYQSILLAVMRIIAHDQTKRPRRYIRAGAKFLEQAR